MSIGATVEAGLKEHLRDEDLQSMYRLLLICVDATVSLRCVQ